MRHGAPLQAECMQACWRRGFTCYAFLPPCTGQALLTPKILNVSGASLTTVHGAVFASMVRC